MAGHLHTAELCLPSPGGQSLFLLWLASCLRSAADVACCIFHSPWLPPVQHVGKQSCRWRKCSATCYLYCISWALRNAVLCELSSTLPRVCFSIFGFHVLSEYMMQWGLGFKCYFKTLELQGLGSAAVLFLKV